MLTDPIAIKIISNAQQKNVRDPNRNRVPFENIIDDFFGLVNLEKQTIIDLGPGQYDFATLVQQVEKDVTIIGVDKDPAVIELGKYLGFRTLELDFTQLQSSKDNFNVEIDGLFCKFSFNAYWNQSAEVAQDMLENEFLKPLKPNGWAWLAPWNGITGNDVSPLNQKQALLELQKEVFRDTGFSCFNLTKQQTIKYGVHGNVLNNPLFTRGLSIPECLEEFREF